MIVRITKNNSSLLSDSFFNLFSYKVNLNRAEIAAKITSDERTYTFIALRDEEIAGYILAYRFPALFDAGDLAYIYDIEVLPQHRRKGLGKQLIITTLDTLKKDGVTEAWLGTETDNDPAIALYKSTGAKMSKDAYYDFTYRLD